MGYIEKLKSIAHGKGKQATHVLRTNLYGTRPAITSSASNALDDTPAIGSAIHSVFNGPKRRPRGAPAIKRQRSA